MSQIPQFEPLDCFKYRKHVRQFAPIEHDLIVVNQKGVSQIAKNAPAAEMKEYLSRCNGSCTSILDGVDTSPALTLLRFEEAAEEAVEEYQIRSNGSTPSLCSEWSKLWPVLDCSNTNNVDPEFESKIRHPRSPCQTSESKRVNVDGSIVCSKISYSINLQEKRISLSYHFHKINGEAKAMARMVTCGLSLKIVQEILGQVLTLLKHLSSGTDNSNMIPLIPVPHPKSIICGMLDCLEDKSSTELVQYRKYLEEIESDIRKQRDRETRKPNGLEINYIKLSEAIVTLSDTRQKLQKMNCLMASIAAIKDTKGHPTACESTGTSTNDALEIPEDWIRHEWKKQLDEVDIRLSELGRRCEQHNLSIEGLQKRVKGILNIVSILRAEREKERAESENCQMRLAQDRRQKTLDYQASMLRKQEIIVAQTKRDNTVMKVIAVLTALFLPGTFIATVFSVPVFNWDQENPIGPHFRTYWYFTVPITTILVVGFSVWFLKMRYDDDREEEERKRSPEDLEKK